MNKKEFVGWYEKMDEKRFVWWYLWWCEEI